MSDEVRSDVGSRPPFSEEEVERSRRLALSRLDELEASFNRVSERLVSVEARLGELAEDLRVRVTAVQEQTREAVAASLQATPAPGQPDVASSLDELRAVIRADVQEIAASIRTAFVEAEQRLAEGQARFLDGAGATGEAVTARTEDLVQSVEAMRRQVAAAPGLEELRASVDALREHVAGAPGTEELRASIDALREQVATLATGEQLRASLDSLREQVPSGTGVEELRASVEALREEVATSTGTEELRASIDALREQVSTLPSGEQLRASLEGLQMGASAGTEELRASMDALREHVAGAPGTEDLRASIDGLREQLASAPPGELGPALESLRSEIGASSGVEEIRQAVHALRSEMSVSKEGEELRAAIAALRQEIVNASGAGGNAGVEDVRAEVGVVGHQLQERLVRVEQLLREVRQTLGLEAAEPPLSVEPEPPIAAEEVGTEPARAVEEVEAAPAEIPPSEPAQEDRPAEIPPSEPVEDVADQEAEVTGERRKHRRLPDIWSWGPKQR